MPEEKEMSKSAALLLLSPVVLLTALLMAAFFLVPKQTVSVYENRTLAVWPDSGDLRAFPRAFESYLTDHFPFRDDFVTSYTQLQLWQGKTTVRNLVVSDGWLLSEEFPLGSGEMAAAAEKVNALFREDGRPLYYLSVPRKSYALYDLYPDPAMAHTENLPRFLPLLDDGVHIVNASEAMRTLDKERRMSFYYKTDFHWNARGAFYAWKLLMDEMVKQGDLPASALPDDESFVEREVTGKRVLGDLNKRMSFLFDTREPIVYVSYKEDLPLRYTRLLDGVLTDVPASEMFASEIEEDEVSYIGAYSGNISYYRIESPRSLTDRKVLVLRDSMQSPTTELFPVIFRQTEFLDVRYLTDKTARDYLSESDADLVVVFYNSSNLTGEMYEFG